MIPQVQSRGLKARGVRVLLSSAALAVSLSFSPIASAQSAADKAAAEALFDEGVKLLKAGDYDQACKKLERSQAVDPGIGTLLYLGECYKKQGKTASAWATFREAASKAEAAGEADRAKAGMKRADDLEEEGLSKVTFEMSVENMGIEGLEVTQAGRPVNRALWGAAVPVDPGQIEVIATAPGYEAWKTTVLVGTGGSAATLTIPPLVQLPAESQPEEAAPVAEEGQSSSIDMSPQAPEKSSGQATTGVVLGIVGVVGVGVGATFGLLAMDAENKAGEFCDGDTCEAGTDGLDLTNQARGRATISTIGFAAGGALLATGLTLYLTAPSGEETARLLFQSESGGGRFSIRTRF